MHWEPFLVLSGLSFILGFERLARLRTQQATLTHKTFLVLLFALGVAAAAYGTMPLTAQFHNIGLGVWRTLSAVLIGGLEIIILVLRSPQADPAAVRRVMWRSGTVTTVLLVTYILGFADAPPIRDLSQSAPTNPAVIVHMAAFGAYIMWGLANMILLCVQRVPKEMRRRTIHATALLLVTAGCTGFLWINAVAISSLVLDFNVNVDILYAPAPVFVGMWVAGGVLLAVGERVYEELASRYMLARLKPLWNRTIELMPEASHLHVRRLPAAARLQRAYVEISDAICTLRMAGTEQLDPKMVAVKLHSGEVATEQAAPTLLTVSKMLPPRRTRREDLELIHDLARAYRQTKGAPSAPQGILHSKP